MEPSYNYSTFKSNTPLPDFPYKSNFISIEGTNIHYIDEGLHEARPILLIHGVPTWSYLFRNIIPELLAAGHRVIAPDLLGFGKSSKPTDKDFYTFDKLTYLLKLFIEKLDLRKIVLFGHDWGAILGLRLSIENENRFSGLAISNGYIPRGGEKIHPIFNIWKFVTTYSPLLPVSRFINMGCNMKLTLNEELAYELPFKDFPKKLAIRILPQLLPFNRSPDKENAKTIWKKLELWEKPFITLFSKNDSITRGYDRILQSHVPGAKNQNHQRLEGGHFLPEDSPIELSQAINKFISTI